MDEEELEQPKKINLGSFFERVDGLEKKANSALSQANSNLGVINNHKTIINNLSISIEAMQTKIRDIANYIIIEKKVEKDLAEDRRLEEQDAEQKRQMIERSDKIQPGGEQKKVTPSEEKTGGGGGFFGGLLKLLAVGGLAAFALKLAPLLVPTLLGLMGAGITVLAGLAFTKLLPKIFDKVGNIITGIKDSIGNQLNKMKESIGKLGKNIVEGTKRTVGGVADFLTGGIFDFDKKGDSESDKISPSGMMFRAGKEIVGDVKERGFSGVVGGVGDFLTGGVFDFDKKGESATDKVSPLGMTMKVGKALFEPLEEKEEKRLITVNYAEKLDDALKRREGYEESGDIKRVEGVTRKIEFYQEKLKRGIVEEQVLATVKPSENPLKRIIGGISDRVENVKQAIVGDNENNDNQSTMVQASKPQVSDAQIKLTQAPMPFIRTIENQYLSISPKNNKLPPEIARMIQ